MSILLPDHGYIVADFVPLDFGGLLTPSLGGPTQRINRIGNRMAVSFTLPPLYSADEGRIFVMRLMRARIEGAIAVLPQSGVKVGAPGSPVIVSGAGSSIVVNGANPYYVIREGQPLSIVHLGRNYLHWCAAETVLSAGGGGTLPIYPMLRTALTAGDVVNLAKPVIEGDLSDDSDRWSKAASAKFAITFTISESR